MNKIENKVEKIINLLENNSYLFAELNNGEDFLFESILYRKGNWFLQDVINFNEIFGEVNVEEVNKIYNITKKEQNHFETVVKGELLETF